MLAQHLILTSAVIVFAMGTGHLFLTLFSRAFQPRDTALYEQIKTVPLNFSSRLLTGPAMTGFNASHSMGPMLFGLIYGYLSLEHGEVLFHSPYLLAAGACFLGGYILIAINYWFWAPLAGLLLALALFVAGIVS
jgi:hypothetical protein